MKKLNAQIDLDKIDTKVSEGFIGQRMIVLPRKILSAIKKNTLINQLFVTDIGFFPHAKYHFRERKHGSKEYILIYCSEGQGVINIFDKNIELRSNSFYIIPPGVRHSYQAVQKDPWSIYWLHFSGSQSINLYEKFQSSSIETGRHIAFEERRISLFENLMDILEDGYSSNNVEFVNISLWQLIGSCIFSSYFSEIGKEKVDGDIIYASIKYMKEYLHEPLTVSTIAEKFNYSNSHFFSLFKKKTGYSPIHYFNHVTFLASRI